MRFFLFFLGFLFPLLGSFAFATGDSITGLNMTGNVDLGSGDTESNTGDTESNTGDTESSTGDTESSTGDTHVGSDDYQLIISEVYLDGRDERIEIANVGQGNFLGTITIQGAKASDLTFNDIFIQPNSVIIITDKTNTFIDSSFVVVSGATLNMPDTEELSLSLLIGGESVDIFRINQSTIAQHDNEKTSYYRALYEDERVIALSQPSQLFNIIGSSSIIAHPGWLPSLHSPDGIITYEEIVCPQAPGIISISEVYFGTSTIAPYIEIQLQTNYPDTIFLTTPGSDEPVSISLPSQLFPHDYVLIASAPTGLDKGQSIVTVDNLQLSAGNYIITRQDGQVLDSVHVQGDDMSLVYYPSVSSSDCRGLLLPHFQPTPGFDHAFLSYIDQNPTVISQTGDCEELECEECSCDDVEDSICSGNVDISLRGIVANPSTGEESIILRLDRGSSPLDLDGYYIMRGNTKRYIHGLLSADEETTLYANYGFSNSSATCVTLHEPGGGQLDDICYNANQTSGYFKRGDGDTDSITTTGDGGTSTIPVDVEITDIDFDPEGTDTNRESLSLVNHNAHEYSDGELWMQIGERHSKTYVHHSLSSGESLTFTGNFRFPNSPICVMLMHQNDIIDVYCYDPNSSSASSDVVDPDIEIVDILYDPPGKDTDAETITLHNLNDRSYDANQLRLQVGDRSSKTYIHSPLSGSSQTTFMENFRFPNSDTCVMLMYESSVLDVFCYHIPRTGGGSSSSKSSFISHPDVKLKITALDYDPPGDDKYHESIVIQYLEGDDAYIDLSDFRLLVGKTKKTLPETVRRGESVTITKTFGFPNTKISCVTLLHGDKPYDVRCYNPKQSSTTLDSIIPDATIDITDIIYNPEGADAGHESISFLLTSTGTVSLSGFHLDINGKYKELPSFPLLTSDEPMTLTGTFGFLNDGACVSLVFDTTVFDTVCYGDALLDIQLPIADSSLSTGVVPDITILDVVYDPDGNDTNNERISLVYSGAHDINLGDIAMFVNGDKRTLQGVLIPHVRTTFQGNYRFPNQGACISLQQGEKVIDEYCYGDKISLPLPSEATSSGSILLQYPSIHIIDVFPDPPGADRDRERIVLDMDRSVDISQLSFIIKGKHFDVSGQRDGQGYFFSQQAFSLPNRVGCVDVEYRGEHIDRYCYLHTLEGKYSTVHQKRLENMSDAQLSILNTVAVKQEKDQDCVTYRGHQLSCKDNKVSKSVASHDSFYKTYIQSMHDYLYYNWPTLYYHTDMRQYMTTYRELLKQVRSGQSTLVLGSREYNTHDFGHIMADQYVDSYMERVTKGMEDFFNNSIPVTGDTLARLESDEEHAPRELIGRLEE